MNILVSVGSYGDFDMPFTETLMIAPVSMNAPAVKEATRLVQADNSKSRDCEDAVKQLRKLGFTPCKYYAVTVGGDL